MSDDNKTDIWGGKNVLTKAWDDALGLKPLNTGIPYPAIGPAVPAHLQAKFETHSRQSGIPLIMATNLIGSESGFNAKAVSPTNALGLAQMTTGARYERLYLDREALPLKAQLLIEEGIERYDRANNPHAPYWAYRAREIDIADDNSTYNLSEQLDALALDEDIALTIGFKHMEFSIKEGTSKYVEKLESSIGWMQSLQTQELTKLQTELTQNSPLKTSEEIDAANAAIIRRLQNLDPHADTAEQARAHNANIDTISASLRDYEPTLEEAAAQNAIIDAAAAKIQNLQMRIESLQPEITRTFTAADLKIFYVCGATGGAQLLEAIADPIKNAQHHRAADYAPASVVRSNPQLFYKNAVGNTVPDNPHYVDVSEFYNHMKDLVGVIPIPDALTSKPQATEPEPWHPPLELPPAP